MGSGLARLGSLTVAIMLQASLVAQAQPYKICIDPGHGGSDPGAVGCGLAEADITLKVGLLLEGLMAADPDLVPLMTRKTDVFVSLQGRADYANDNGVDRFASIHNNAYNGNVSGIETFCYTYGSMASFDQRDRIQAEMTATWPNLPDRGAKTAGFAVIKNTSMPATLSELAFIDFCAADALLLADPVEQLAAAAAHHTAIRESLGLEGPIGPAEKTGILRGIIYEDQGVGAADMSVRIPGTLVKALGQDGKTVEAVADDPTASWAFSLTPETYTVTATFEDYYEGSRVCKVLSDQETWCSLGLFPLSPIPDTVAVEPWWPDVPVDPPDVPMVVDPGAEDTFVAADLYEAPGADGSVIVNPVDASQPLESGGGTCHGHRSGGMSGFAVLCLSLFTLILLMGGRRRTAGLALILLATGGSSCHPAQGDVPARLTGPVIRGTDLAVVDALPVTRAADHTQPVWSPDGKSIAFSGGGFGALKMIPAVGGEPVILATGRSSGYAPEWRDGAEAIAYRSPGQRRSDVPALAVRMDGTRARPPVNATPGRWVVVRDDRVFLRVGSGETVLSLPGDRHCCALTSRDGRFVAFTGLGSGIHLHDSRSGLTVGLGAGNHPRFSPDGTLLAWDHCTDDGERLTACTLHLADLRGPSPVVRTLSGAPPLARHPDIAPDGSRIAFESDGAIWVGRLDL